MGCTSVPLPPSGCVIVDLVPGENVTLEWVALRLDPLPSLPRTGRLR
jgi:hypothetical protein